MWIDDVIGVFAPMAAFRRKQARMALQVNGRAYDGAKTGRRTDGWMASGTSCACYEAYQGMLMCRAENRSGV